MLGRSLLPRRLVVHWFNALVIGPPRSLSLLLSCTIGGRWLASPRPQLLPPRRKHERFVSFPRQSKYRGNWRERERERVRGRGRRSLLPALLPASRPRVASYSWDWTIIKVRISHPRERTNGWLERERRNSCVRAACAQTTKWIANASQWFN